LKIVVVSLRGPSAHWRAGGGREVITQIGKCWVEDGHQVRVLCTREGSELPHRETVHGIEVIRSGAYHSATAVLGRLFLTQYREWADVVVENILAFPLYVPLYSRQPTAAIVHHVMGRSWFDVLPFPKALFGYLTERSIPRFYRHNRLVVVSEGTRDDLVDLGASPDQIVVAPCGVDTLRYVPGRKSSEPLLCFLGRLDDRRKRIEDLLDAFPYVAERVPGVRLVIAGGGQREAALKAKAAAYDNVEFAGYLGEEEKIDLYQRSWVGVFPSSKEGFLLTALEASACGTPAVVYEHPGVMTVVDGQTGLVVPEGDSQALASAVVSLLQDPQRRLEMGRKAREYARGFSWRKMADTILDTLSRESGEPVAGPAR
jgi:glycosyltransferase involved in cell wall biosynthesis